MKTPEKEIERIIYKSPWLINDRYVISRIQGSRFGADGKNELGRQVNVGKNNNRYIDVLLKDTRDNRPVIIEIKKDHISRDNIGQILEYRGLIISLNETERVEWEEDFGCNYFAPKMILIGGNASEEIILSANLAGIEIILFNRSELSNIELKEFRRIGDNIQTINNLRAKGIRTIKERINWTRSVLSTIKDVIRDMPEVSTLDRISSLNDKKFYANNHSIFLDIPIFYKNEYLCGFYEYYVDSDEEQFSPELKLSEEFIYFDFALFIEDEEHSEVISMLMKQATQFLTGRKLEVELYNEINAPIARIPRELLDNSEKVEEFKTLIADLTKKAKEYYDEIYKTINAV